MRRTYISKYLFKYLCFMVYQLNARVNITFFRCVQVESTKIQILPGVKYITRWKYKKSYRTIEKKFFWWIQVQKYLLFNKETFLIICFSARHFIAYMNAKECFCIAMLKIHSFGKPILKIKFLVYRQVYFFLFE